MWFARLRVTSTCITTNPIRGEQCKSKLASNPASKDSAHRAGRSLAQVIDTRALRPNATPYFLLCPLPLPEKQAERSMLAAVGEQQDTRRGGT